MPKLPVRRCACRKANVTAAGAQYLERIPGLPNRKGGEGSRTERGEERKISHPRATTWLATVECPISKLSLGGWGQCASAVAHAFRRRSLGLLEQAESAPRHDPSGADGNRLFLCVSCVSACVPVYGGDGPGGGEGGFAPAALSQPQTDWRGHPAGARMRERKGACACSFFCVCGSVLLSTPPPISTSASRPLRAALRGKRSG